MAREEHPGTQHGLLRSLAADPAYGPLSGLLLALTVLTGVVDAVSILAPASWRTFPVVKH